MKKSIGIFTFVALLAVVFFTAITWRADAQWLIASGSRPAPESRKDISNELRSRLLADRENETGPGTDLSKVPRAFPEAGAIVYAYENVNRRLISFDASAPGTLLTDIPLTGIGEDSLYGIDFRPSDGMLYGILLDGFPTPSRLVKINISTGEVSRVHPTNTVSTPIDSFYGFDFDPIEDRLRNVGREGFNRRLNQNTGQLVANDTTLRYATGDVNAGVVPRIVHIANTISTVSGVTTVYGVDSQANTLVRIGGLNGNPLPNAGEITTIGPLGVDPTNFGSMDIQPGATNAYASLFIDSIPTFVSIDLATGAASVIGRVGGDETQVIDGIAIQIGPIVVPTPTPGLTPTPTPAVSPTPTPTTTPTPGPSPTPFRALRILNSLAIQGGDPLTIPIEHVSLGDSSSTSFTVNFNPQVLTNPVVSKGLGALPNAILTTDTSQVATGKIGITLASTGTYQIGTHRIINIGFNVVTGTTFGAYPLTFGNTPTGQTLTTSSGTQLPATYQTGTVFIGVTAAGVEVSGRVLTSDGRGLRNASVSMVGPDGVRRLVTTSSFGVYRFEDVDAGGSYVISVGSKRYNFSPRIVQVVDTLTGVDFIGN